MQGHEEYHMAHSFFFSSGCVYMLLFDCSLEVEEIVKENNLLYWFHFLQTQIGDKSPVIIIATKFDVLWNKFSFNHSYFDNSLNLEKITQHINHINQSKDFFFLMNKINKNKNNKKIKIKIKLKKK
jgi:hypothetical protein